MCVDSDFHLLVLNREVERILTEAVQALGGGLAGIYYPLVGCSSYYEKPGRVIVAAKREDHSLFQKPEYTLLLSPGMGLP